jgi:hypothetical protein
MPQNLMRVLKARPRGEIPARRIARTEERQSLRRRGWPGFRAVASGEELGKPFGTLRAASDRQERSDDVPDHVVQECVRLDLDHDLLSASRDRNLADAARRRARLAGDRSERAEIVLADQRDRRPLHRGEIERNALPCDMARIERRAHRPVEDSVTIAPRARCVARVKVFGDDTRPAHGDGRRKVAVRPKRPGALAAQCTAVEVHDLAARMHTGVGASRADDLDRMRRDRRNRALDGALHARSMREPLPAEEIGAVVFDAEGDAHSRGASGWFRDGSLAGGFHHSPANG